ncbi:MAG: signal recognition particle-docking protein FtsY [Waddliaceae bacterium]
MAFNFIKAGFQKVKNALSKTRSLLGSKLRSIFSKEMDEEALEELEQTLYEADLGVETSIALTEQIRKAKKKDPTLEGDRLLELLSNETLKYLTSKKAPEVTQSPHVVLIVGVNGSGKTTSVVKLAKLYQSQGKKVLVAAADTYRAAAAEQLEKWLEKLEIDLVRGSANSDPASVTFDAVSAGLARGADVVIIDTAGRLQTRSDLMKELEKIRRVSGKQVEGAPHETLLILDATIGQNAIDQAKIFQEYTPLTGLILTKLDGTAKGGIAIQVQKSLDLPIQYIATGESWDDFDTFDPELYVKALFE